VGTVEDVLISIVSLLYLGILHYLSCNKNIHIKKSLKIQKGGNQNPYIEEEQTTQWPKEKV